MRSLISRKEPFRFFFLLGLGIAAIGLAPWLLFQLGFMHGWPGPLHAMTMTQGFLLAFAVGFLGTMLPRRTGSPPLSPLEFALLAFALVGLPVCLLGGALRPAHLLFGLVLVTLAQYALRSLRQSTQNHPPLPSFIFIPVALVQGLVGVILLFANSLWRSPPWLPAVAKQLMQQGILVGLVLGLSPMLAPLLWTGNAPLPPRPAGLGRALHGGVAAALVASFIIEQAASARAGLLLRGVLCAALLWRVALPWEPRKKSGLHRLLFRVALWFLPVGLLLAAAVPLHRVAFLHLTFIAGLSVLTFATSVHVTLLHSGHETEAEQTSIGVVATALSLFAAAVVRVCADWLGIHFLAGLTVAAALLLLALGIWGAFLFLKMRPPVAGSDLAGARADLLSSEEYRRKFIQKGA